MVKKLDILAKCLDKNQERPKKIVRQKELLNQWYVNELNQKEDTNE